MKHVAVVVMLLLAQPVYATSLRFNLSGSYSAGEVDVGDDYYGTFGVSYLLNAAPRSFTYADVVAPDGTVVHDYLTGTEYFSAARLIRCDLSR